MRIRLSSLCRQAGGIVNLAAFFFLIPLCASAQSTVAGLPDQPAAAPQQTSASQTTAPASSSSSTQAAPQSTPDKKSNAQTTTGQGKVAGTSNDRLFYTLPNFLTLRQNGKLPPLTVGQKFKVVALGNFDPVQYPWWGLLSAIGQADDDARGFRTNAWIDIERIEELHARPSGRLGDRGVRGIG